PQGRPQRIIKRQPFHHGEAAAITRAQAAVATMAAAFGTQAAEEALVDDQLERGGDGGLVGAHDSKPFEDAAAGAGVQRGYDEMAGEGGADRYIGSLLVADFADNQDLRILAEEMAGGFGEVQPPGFIDFSLHDAGDDLLGWVFDGDDVAPSHGGERAQTGVYCGRFAAPGRSSQ